MLRTRRHLAILFLGLVHGAALAQAAADPAQQLYAEAKSAEQAGDLQAAEEKYQAVVRAHPQSAGAYNNLGHFFYAHGLLEKAIPPLQRASALDPKVAAPHALLGFVYYQMGNYKGASQALTTAARLNPADRVAKLFLARSLGELDDLNGARVLLEQLRHDDPNNPEVLYTLGTIYSGLAKTTLGQIPAVAPNSYLIELLLGSSAESKQHYTEAAEHFKAAISRSPNIADLHYHYAHALSASGDVDGALVAYRRALELDPYNPSSNWEAARILVQSAPGEALQLADRAVEISPSAPEAHMQRGRALLALGKARDAVAEFQKASTLDPEDETAHFQLAKAYRQLGLTKEESDENAAFQRIQKERHATGEKTLSSNETN